MEKTIRIKRTKGCNNLVEITTYYEDDTFKDVDNVYCNEEDLCDDCKEKTTLADKSYIPTGCHKPMIEKRDVKEFVAELIKHCKYDSKGILKIEMRKIKELTGDLSLWK